MNVLSAWTLVRCPRTALTLLAAVALVCVALSRHPHLSFIGSYGTDVGWVYLAGYLAACDLHVGAGVKVCIGRPAADEPLRDFVGTRRGAKAAQGGAKSHRDQEPALGKSV